EANASRHTLRLRDRVGRTHRRRGRARIAASLSFGWMSKCRRVIVEGERRGQRSADGQVLPRTLGQQEAAHRSAARGPAHHLLPPRTDPRSGGRAWGAETEGGGRGEGPACEAASGAGRYETMGRVRAQRSGEITMGAP